MNGVRLFAIRDIPVWVSPWFFLLMVYLVFRSGFETGLVWGFTISTSILVHEFGHALVARHFGLRPEILLHGFGGLCSHQGARSDRDDAMIIAAGPGAGLVLGLLSLGLSFFAVGPTTPPVAQQLIQAFVFINLFWSMVNLMPMWPLDGGQLFRLGMLKLTTPARAERITHITSIVVLCFAAWWASGHLGTFALLICGLLAYQNIRALQSGGSGAPVRVESKHAKALLVEAEEAYLEGDWREASRLCHQLRDEKNVGEKVIRRAWAILGVSAARLGQEEDALHYLTRAPVTAETVEARIECLYRLTRDDDLEELLRSADFEKIDPARRAEILSVVR